MKMFVCKLRVQYFLLSYSCRIKNHFVENLKTLRNISCLVKIAARSEKNLKINSLHIQQDSIRTRTITKNKTQLGRRKMVTGVKTIPRTTKPTSTDAQLEQNRSKEGQPTIQS